MPHEIGDQSERARSFHSSPAEATQAPAERFLYLACLHEGTGVDEPDFVAVVDADPGSDTYGRIVHETPMPNVGDELHHFGWNRCSSACHGPDRSHLIVPGFRSSRIHILDVSSDPGRPRIEKVIEPEELAERTGYSRPHTVHCMPGDNVVISMLGDRDGGGSGGFACLDARSFEIKGRWENGGSKPPLNYDFWYQPRKNVLISSEFGEPNAYEGGFDPADVAAGRYGRNLHFWDLAERRLEQTLDLGDAGLIPLEVRWLHDPDAEQGFVGAALSSNMFRFHRANGSFAAEPVIDVENEELEGWPLPGGVDPSRTWVITSAVRGPMPCIEVSDARRALSCSMVMPAIAVAALRKASTRYDFARSRRCQQRDLPQCLRRFHGPHPVAHTEPSDV